MIRASKQGLSVVIPTFGRDAVLCESIRYLLELPAPADELLVIDQTPAHQPDTEAQLAAWHNAGRIRWIRHQPPGVVGAMNRGLHEAKGDIVLFLDDDIIPDANLVVAHRIAHEQFPEAWAVVGQVVQGENTETLKTEMLKGDEVGRRKTVSKLISECQRFSISAFRANRTSALRRDLGFKFDGTEPAWVENMMAGNLSVKREQALAIGGFDENFIPPVSFRFETEFAKRIVASGGRIRFEPKASILHLRSPSGGTRSQGSHLTSASLVHGVGDYYYALRCGKGLDRFLYMLRRPFREVRTRFHLRHPCWVPVKFIGELRAIHRAFGLNRAGSKLLASEDAAKAFYDTQFSGSLYAAYAEPKMHPFFKELNHIIDQYGSRNGKWLEVGCGRGYLQDVVAEYTGVDVTDTVATFLHKPFCCAPAEALPFENNIFDGLWSYAVLEHVENPEQALTEMRRVLKTGGILVLSPAWQCRPWAGRDYAWKPWRDLSLPDRLRKALIPLRNALPFRALSIFSRRLWHLTIYLVTKQHLPFYTRPLKPNYSEYKVVDSDARHNMDPFDAILWFRSRGDRVLSHPNWVRYFLVRTGTLVIEKGL